MHLLLAEPLPFDPNQVTPGVIGFAATALVATAIMLLLWDFNRRVRRINDRADVKARIEAELAAQRGASADAGGEAGAGTGGAPGSTDAGPTDEDASRPSA